MTSHLDHLNYRIQKGPRSKPTVIHVDQLKKYQEYSFDNWLAEPKTMGAILTNSKSARQHIPKSAAAAKGLRGAPTAAEGAGEKLHRSQRKPAWTADYQMD